MNKTNRFVYFLQEITIVVIGVLIAVSIGNYKEKVDNEKYIATTLLAIENEVEVSKTEVDTILQKHIMLYKVCEEQIENSELTLGELVGNAGGFQVASIKNISLRFFIANKAELLEFELISQLLEIEQYANSLSDKIKMLSEFAYEHVNNTDVKTKTKFIYLLANVIDGEQTLSSAYDEFLEKNQERLKR